MFIVESDVERPLVINGVTINYGEQIVDAELDEHMIRSLGDAASLMRACGRTVTYRYVTVAAKAVDDEQPAVADDNCPSVFSFPPGFVPSDGNSDERLRRDVLLALLNKWPLHEPTMSRTFCYVLDEADVMVQWIKTGKMPQAQDSTQPLR